MERFTRFDTSFGDILIIVFTFVHLGIQTLPVMMDCVWVVLWLPKHAWALSNVLVLIKNIPGDIFLRS